MYDGLFRSWQEAMTVTHFLIRKRGGRYAVRHLSHVRPEHVPHCDGAVWNVQQVAL